MESDLESEASEALKLKRGGASSNAISGVLAIDGQELRAVDQGIDSIWFWDDSQSSMQALLAGDGLLIDETILKVSFGTTSGTVCQGNDSRLSDARTPTAHGHGWSEISAKPTTFPPTIGSGAGDAVAGNDARLADARTPTAHGHAWSEITSKPTTFAPVIGTGAADAAAGNHTHGAASATAYDDQSGSNKGNLLKTDSFGSTRVNESYAYALKLFANDLRTAAFTVDTVDHPLSANRVYKAPDRDGFVALVDNDEGRIKRSITFSFSGGGSAITTGTKAMIPKLPFGFIPTNWHLSGSANDETGAAENASITFNIAVNDFSTSGFPTSDVGGTDPALSSAVGASAATDFTDTVWAEGQSVLVTVTGTPTAKWATLTIEGTES